MALTLEDGSGVTGADSYISLADFQTFATDYGFTVPATDADCESWLRRASFAMDRLDWKGLRVATDQPLAWPRADVYVDHELLSTTAIPRNIVYGQAMLAIELYAESLAVDTVGGGAAVSEHTVKVDAIEESKKFDLVRRNEGKLSRPAAKASSMAQFADYLRTRGMAIARA